MPTCYGLLWRWGTKLGTVTSEPSWGGGRPWTRELGNSRSEHRQKHRGAETQTLPIPSFPAISISFYFRNQEARRLAFGMAGFLPFAIYSRLL